MLNWIKKHFIPHKGNEHRPHILRDDSVRNIIALVLILEFFTFILPTVAHINTKIGGMKATVISAVLTNLTNEERETQNLQTLTENPILNKAAEMKAVDMATKGYFAHTSPEGKTPWYWLDQVGYNYQYAGENLAINFSDSKDVTNAWLNSPTHKANIEKINYTEIGTGIATGIYEGRETVFVAQVYANPMPQAIKQIQPQKTEVIKSKELSKITNDKEQKKVLGAETVINTENKQNIETKPIQNPSFWQKLLASPRNTSNVFFYIIFGIIAFALLIYMLIKMANYHFKLITNGLIVLAIIGGIFIINYYITHYNMTISQSLDYSSENK